MSKQSKKEGDIRSENPLYQLCVFDDRRGTEEGNEDDKVLVAWPSTRASSELASVVGLAQAMISFMSNFEPEEPCSSINTTRQLWALHQLEPHIWYLMLEDKQLLGASLREAAIKAVLQRLALLLRLLHGPMDALLAKDSTGAAARQLLKANVTEFMDRFLQGRAGGPPPDDARPQATCAPTTTTHRDGPLWQ
ncbi:hypothetical protein WJX84_001645 [Apatococcus fuscideae]|uniref:CCZ1/INTU/HSP4 first Longin domain-containing protein n=1 Tax=Apatococcus fuscideae TaxID=2026836 RepID=A0AAW1SM67_9CHLO